MLLLMEGGFSSVEMRVLKERMKEGHDQAFREGRFLGGVPPPPYVYDPREKKPVLDQKKLTSMHRLWELAETKSAHAIAEELSMPEIAVRRAISDDRLLWYQALRVDPSTGEHITCEWEPCMTAEQAARIRTGRRVRNKGADRRTYAALFSNLRLLFCGYCGNTVKTWQNSRVKKDGTRNDYYGCRTKNVKNKCPKARLVPQSLLHDKLLMNLFNTLSNLEEIKGNWLLEQEGGNVTGELEALARKEAKERDKKKRLVSAISEGVIDFADAKGQMAAINTSIEQLEAERRQLTLQRDTPLDWEALDLSREDFDQLLPDDQRQFLQVAIQRVTIFENYALISYPFPRNADGDREARVNFPARQEGYIRSKK